ncbi:metal ABC transporter permease [Lachnoclostridium phytofermentans]|uniref:ABC-3 protein n=1 Tax=Lachnoclostridium phytofermentans (strain ATCC 700394 / DSM 18823 / ISDg) TaxID=357809 RepID=A9KHZ3_LACP7|nr:metal ABC transporter permease [Lachnoclostridium phytofermentans]ABX43840.1 ABC-3 protein [Lachnoclostridium phytofermentans ISDg]
MDTIYHLMEAVLPFDFISYNFMKNALLAVLVITPLFGMLGTMIVNNKLAFFSDALGHSVFTGMAIGVILGIGDTNISTIAFAVVFALLLNFIKRNNTASTDTIISVFSSTSTAIGLVILSSGGNFSKYSSLFVGDVLSITPNEIGLLVIIFAVTLVFFATCFNKLHSLSLNSSLARSKGVNISVIENLFAVLIALIVMLSIKWVGLLILNALLILPAASSRNISSNMREYHLFSVIISVFSGILGLILSYYLNLATGPMIVIISAVIFFSTLWIKGRVES